LPQLANLVEAGISALRAGGRIHYVGAGTSGRFGALDAAEVPPTFGVDRGVFVVHLAGGDHAMVAAVEDAEDSAAAGAERVSAHVQPDDLVVGLAASGSTTFVAGALRQARSIGAATALVTSNPFAPLIELADHVVCVDTGPEVITGSTRMKAGTAQKLVLHSFSTAMMVRLGHTYSNLMVDVVATNAKLRARVVHMLCEASEVDPDAAAAALDAAEGDTRLALLSLLTGRGPKQVSKVLADSERSVKRALNVVKKSD
jgi:N-acetylmuramic acid 6-phosphate etherase